MIDAITFHEAAHGFVVHLLGDDTAWWLGRVSFNPVKHIDTFGTILLRGILLCAIPVRLRQTGVGQFSEAAIAATGHGASRCCRTRDDHAFACHYGTYLALVNGLAGFPFIKSPMLRPCRRDW